MANLAALFIHWGCCIQATLDVLCCYLFLDAFGGPFHGVSFKKLDPPSVVLGLSLKISVPLSPVYMKAGVCTSQLLLGLFCAAFDGYMQPIYTVDRVL